MSNVYAFRPNAAKPDEWFYVSEYAPGELMAKHGEVAIGDQCGACGGSNYTLHFQVVRCSCGARYPIRVKNERQVTF